MHAHLFLFWSTPCASLCFCKPLRARCCSNGFLTHDITVVTSLILFSSNAATFTPYPALQSIIFQLPAAFHGDWSLLNTCCFQICGMVFTSCLYRRITMEPYWEHQAPNVLVVLFSNQQSLSFSKPTLALLGLFVPFRLLSGPFYQA